MSRGYVYVLTNESMPNLVKIGMTTRSVQQRVAELYQTGVPTPFKVNAEVYTPDCAELEANMHFQFAGDRVSSSREFFSANPFVVISRLDEMLREQLYQLVQEFDESLTVVDDVMHVGEADLMGLAASADISFCDISGVLSELRAGEIAEANARFQIKKTFRNSTVNAESVVVPLTVAT